ncbi:ComEC family competence protein [Croceibacterium atlanticum]|uniref:ComEC family competence protein n=2 Tax=Croceibacterium atlanticum TaxID=1267766 RepID=A0A0F7KQ35_9SPHN|nr:ComEC/Rec2 family competence protein [Croceibacterium atlanticum]AKH41664.1 ComEC family competence protein [Croceibacterium atlanticum]
MRALLSSAGNKIEAFLADAGLARGPWLAVFFAAGIAAWFVLGTSTEWVLAIACGLLVPLAATAALRGADGRSHILAVLVGCGLVFAAGVGIVWARSEMVGAQPIERPLAAEFTGRILERIEQPAEQRIRLVLAAREPDTQRAIKLRINVPLDADRPDLTEGALIRFGARLMPPAPPMLPGAYDFSQAAWFAGLAATGSVNGEIQVIEAGEGGAFIANLQRRLSAHVRAELPGSSGAIAAAFASGDRGAISPMDEEAMRDAGLTHLLSISGLHVSAVIAAAYFIALKLLALWPWLALRLRLPVMAAAIAALAGIGYTLLTGAEVPTVRSCAGALLVLGALALGREPLSLRMVAVAAMFVLLLWPESLVGPSFQMSFAAVIAIVALHEAAPVRAFLRPRDEGWLAVTSRRAAMLLLTGLVIEIALMPIVLFHFHRAGVYGALANVIAIPLVTFVSMPLIAIALLLDVAGLGAPGWWLVGHSLDMLLAIAHFTASQTGAVKLMPQMGQGTFALFIAGGLWLALWRGKVRLWGLAPSALATVLLLMTPTPDILISGDGRHVGITGEDERLLVLRESRSDYAKDNLLQMAGSEEEPVALANWAGADCSRDFCTVTLRRGERDWILLMSRSREMVAERALAAACERSDIVIADRWLPSSCRPRWLKADRRMLSETGGLSIVLDGPKLTSVAEGQGNHGWWQAAQGR